MDCGALSAPMNGSSYGGSTVFPNSVLFNCDPGFILNGSSKRTCQASGTWSGFPTVCCGMSKIHDVKSEDAGDVCKSARVGLKNALFYFILYF